MFDNEVMISSVDEYFQHPVVNILLSLVITASVMANVFILVYMQNISPWFYLLMFSCFFVRLANA